MALKDWFSRRTPLQLALERGTQNGADLDDELRKLGDFQLKSKADAEAVCEVLARIASEGPTVGGESGLHAVVGLFQDVDGPDCPASPIMAEQGNPLLVQVVDRALLDQSLFDCDDVLFALKILALYGTRRGTEAVLRAARLPLQPDAYMWSVIFRMYSTEHPQREWLMNELSDPLPTGFIAISLLDSANDAHRAGATDRHPFDSPAGIQQLERWITDNDEDHFSYAVSSVGALPFLTSTERDALIAVAFDHPSADVQMEAAWVAAKLGREAGVRWLARTCLDVSRSAQAIQYLEEMGLADAIPREAFDADFQAKAEFARWLAHPNELGRPPDELEIVDRCELEWPPDRERRPFWLLKFRIKDETGLKEDDVDVGVVGSVTFCLFSYQLRERPPEDAYAIHCYWEMAARGLISEADVPESSNEYDSMLPQLSLRGTADAQIVAVAELSPELQYPQTLVALATATREGDAGWIVLDGPRSRWYAAAEMPSEAPDKTVLMLHVGRRLLGFKAEPDRKTFLQPVVAKRPPHEIVLTYERLLDQARSDMSQARKLLADDGILDKAFDDYVSALVSERNESKAVCACAAYEAMLSIAIQFDPSFTGEMFDCFSPLGEHFDSYVEALGELGRHAEAASLIEKFRPNWDHNLGYAKLGTAAFQSGHDRLAESLLVNLRNSAKDWCRSHEMNFLAEIWCRQGRVDEAHALLIDAMQGLVAQSRSATGSDRKLFEDWFQDRRSAYLRIFPDRGAEELARRAIPISTLGQVSREG